MLRSENLIIPESDLSFGSIAALEKQLRSLLCACFPGTTVKPKSCSILSGLIKFSLLRISIGLTLLLGCIFVPFSMAAPLTIEETRGKQLYVTGTSSSGKAVSAIIGQQSIELPGSMVPCTNCHGEDGQGRPEGGILPSSITWHFLIKSYGHQHPDSRKHPAFTEQSFAAAITSGIDPAGNLLDVAMPRYQLSSGDVADLVAYLNRLSTDYDPGLTEMTIRVGSLLPVKGRLSDMGRAMKSMLTAYFAEINAAGGIYNRTITLDVAEYNSDSDATRKSIVRLLEAEPVFAMVATVAGGMEKEFLALTESNNLPQVGSYTLFPENSFSRSRSTFYLFSGLRQQSRALVDYAADVLGLENPRIALIGPSGDIFQAAADGVEMQRQKHGWDKADLFSYLRGRFDAQQFAAEVHKQPPDAIFYFGGNQTLPVLLALVDKLTPQPYVFLSGSLAGQDVFSAPIGLHGRIFLSYPTLPRDQTNRADFVLLLKKHGLSTRHLAAQIIAYSSARLLVEGLQQAGRELSRKKLIQALESQYQFDNGLTPLLTYGPNRHIGSTGAYVVAIDLEKNRCVAESRWIEPR
jgi:ABC-type branched-subunit amino acid transport system substrate-binding protein